jgi:hypothetical protein
MCLSARYRSLKNPYFSVSGKNMDKVQNNIGERTQPLKPLTEKRRSFIRYKFSFDKLKTTILSYLYMETRDWNKNPWRITYIRAYH